MPNGFLFEICVEGSFLFTLVSHVLKLSWSMTSWCAQELNFIFLKTSLNLNPHKELKTKP